MYWRRIVKFKMIFQCCYPDRYGIPQLDRPAINENVEYKKEFGNREEMEDTGSLVIWADIMSEAVAQKIADYQCEELRFYPDSGCNIEIYIIDTKEEVEEIEIPKFVLGQIEVIETRIREAETLDEKIALGDELKRLKERYGISK